ncbi:MAG: DUF4185 domain-containing protein [Verrucomicrobiales bacterium]
MAPSPVPNGTSSIVLLAALVCCFLNSSFAAVNPTVPPDVSYVTASTRKISQLIGDLDYQWGTFTETRTQSRYGISGSDLGVPFSHNGVTYIVFGDTHGGGVFGDRDPMAFTTDTNPEDGLQLAFPANGNVWRPITIPGISQGAFEVPLDGVSISNKMYLYHSTDHSASVTMGRSVLAVSADDGMNFQLLYDFSTNHFINVSANKINLRDWPGFPAGSGDGLAIFGSGSYRASDVRLAFQPAASIEERSALRYFAGLDVLGNPTWSVNEADAIALFDQPCVGELSVAYNRFIKRWIMLFNCGTPRGINYRTARQPWGPWTEPRVLFEPWDDLGYAHFMHVNWTFRNYDTVHNPGRQDEWGGEYGPYMFKELATGTDNRTTIYWTLSTWNPYVTVLMKSQLQVANSPVITVQPFDQIVSEGEPATFELTGSAVGALSYRWQRNGTDIPDAVSNVFTLPIPTASDESSAFRCVVSNPAGSVTSNPVRVVIADNAAPVPEILLPADGELFRAGTTMTFSGEATDPEDGLLPSTAFHWKILFFHGSYNVPILGTLSDTKSGGFSVPERGEQATNVFYRVLLTVEDSGGRQVSTFRDVHPQISTLSFRTEPSGLQITLDGTVRTTPLSIPSVVGMSRTLSAVTPGLPGGRAYDFKEWSDGGALSHTLSVPETNATYTAVFRTPTILVPANSVWKYLVTPAAPSASWKSITFDDASWSSGAAQLGYGDDDGATPIGFGPDPNNRYITTYFRRTFTIADPAVFGTLTVRLLRDDGGIVYLNGSEIFRSNMGGGVPVWATLAPVTALPADETSQYYSTNLPPTLLRAGPNVVAVEIHQNGANSSDLSFALELRAAEHDPTLLVGRSAANQVTLSWPFPSSGFVLQSALSLQPPAPWSNVNQSVSVINARNEITVPFAAPAQFFRLRKP